MRLRKIIAGGTIVVMSVVGGASSAWAHNEGHVTTGNGGCVDVGGGNNPPVGVAHGNDGHARGIHHAIHAGQGKSAPQPGSC